MKFLSVGHCWRVFAAGICYVVFGIGAFLPGLYVFVIAMSPLHKDRKQAHARKAIQLLCRFYVNFMQALGVFSFALERNYQLNSELNSEREFKDSAEWPVAGHLIISNHSTLIDALFILAYVDNLCCVVKQQLCVNPVTRIPVKLAGFISNDAEDFFEQASAKIAAGENVLIFPEGTRNSYDTQLEMRRGAAKIAVICNCPVLPLVIKPMPRVVQKGQSWYELPPVKSHIVMRINQPQIIVDCIDTSLPRTLQYRRLTQFWREYYLAQINSISLDSVNASS